ncbi:MAG: TlyA family RNA methyltransferase [Actinobacteria bacterium]|nr:TlyA family RNA methyltransferase [Actinomycetota bacterium]
MVKKRADIYLVEAGLVSSREQAQRLINGGKVFIDGRPVGKASSLIEERSHVTILEEASYVSRGGLKLEKALHKFGVNPGGKFTIDVGASTGGFTDCLLRHGAKTVVTIDVGYGQLAWSLRRDPRVIVMERTNIRYVKPEDLPQLADIVTIDVSFISLKKIHGSIARLLEPDGRIIALVKPQFEAGRERLGKKGVVKDSRIHKDILNELWVFYEEEGMVIRSLTYSPIKGPEGNIEFLLYLSFNGVRTSHPDRARVIDDIVEEAHRELAGDQGPGM